LTWLRACRVAPRPMTAAATSISASFKSKVGLDPTR
jgi:hypothetical protein